MNKRPTVTIGISAFNEESNIKNLIKSLTIQKEDNFILEKIIIISDGSTDKTVDHVKETDYCRIKLITSKKRRGLWFRLNEIIKLNESDILVKIDADAILADKFVVHNLIASFNKKVTLVGGHAKPLPGETFIEKVHVLSDEMWHNAVKNVNKGNNIHNHHGQISAMRREFIEKIKFNQNLHGYDDYVYLSNVMLGGKFRHSPKAISFYKTPDNLSDYIKQARRFVSAKNQFSRLFGNWILKEYSFPRINIYKSYFRAFMNSPLVFLVYVLVELTIRLSLKYSAYKPTVTGWEISKSTKNL